MIHNSRHTHTYTVTYIYTPTAIQTQLSYIPSVLLLQSYTTTAHPTLFSELALHTPYYNLVNSLGTHNIKIITKGGLCTNLLKCINYQSPSWKVNRIWKQESWNNNMKTVELIKVTQHQILYTSKPT